MKRRTWKEKCYIAARNPYFIEISIAWFWSVVEVRRGCVLADPRCVVKIMLLI